jgi:quinol monooxygenase YgiN
VILVTGTIDIDPDQRDAFVAAAQKVTAPTRAEEGCEHYAFSADLDDAGRFHVSERWASEESMAAHMASPHLAAFLGDIAPMVRASEVWHWDGATPSRLM